VINAYQFTKIPGDKQFKNRVMARYCELADILIAGLDKYFG